jgi:hypothetical protein
MIRREGGWFHAARFAFSQCMAFGEELLEENPAGHYQQPLRVWATQCCGVTLIFPRPGEGTHAEIAKQQREQAGQRRSGEVLFAGGVRVVLVPAGDGAYQGHPEEQEAGDLQPKNLAHAAERLQERVSSRAQTL